MARVLARTLDDLRATGIRPAALPEGWRSAAQAPKTGRGFGVAKIYERYHAEIESKFFDETRLYAEAETADAPFLHGTAILLSPDLEPRADEFRFQIPRDPLWRAENRRGESRIAGCSPCSRTRPASRPWPGGHCSPAPVARESSGRDHPADGGAFEAPGPSPAVASFTEGLLGHRPRGQRSPIHVHAFSQGREGMAFDEMAVALPQPDVYAPILVDLFSRAKVPFQAASPSPSRHRPHRAFVSPPAGLPRLRSRGPASRFLTFAPAPFRQDWRLRSAASVGVRPDHRELKVVSGTTGSAKPLDHFISEEAKASATCRTANGPRAPAG